jgi:hypothetical protein
MRGLRSITAAATLAAAVVLVAAPASADVLRSNTFQAFDFRVSCGVQVKQLGGMSCFSQGIPSKELDGFVALGAHGDAEVGERGDSPWLPGKMRPLEPGRPWRRAGVACEIAQAKRPKVAKCLNADGNGFLVGPTGYKLIITR